MLIKIVHLEASEGAQKVADDFPSKERYDHMSKGHRLLTMRVRS
jgi:hypothetical protein